MILSGARGILQKIDTTEKTVTLRKHSGSEDYECSDSEFEPDKWKKLVGKMVDIQLCDFLVVDVSEHSDQAASTHRGDE